MRLTAIFLSLLLLLPASASFANPLGPKPAPTTTYVGASVDDEQDYHPRRVIVEYQSKASRRDKTRARSAVGSKSRRRLGPRAQNRNKSKVRDFDVLTLDGRLSVKRAVAKLSKTDGIVSAQPDFRRRALYSPNDPGFSPNQWHLHNTGQTIKGTPGTAGADINATQAWDIAAAIGTIPTVVAVIDTGVDLTHPDLTPNLWTNPGEIAGNGLDDDGNGYVDDSIGQNWAGLSQWTYGWAPESPYFMFYETPLGGSAPHYSEAAQSFRGHGGKISGISLNLYKYGTPAQPVTVSIRSNRSGPDLASYTVAPADVKDHAYGAYWDRWVYGTLTPPLPVTDGATYYLVAQTANNDASNRYGLGDSDGLNAFPNGNLSVKNGSWTDLPSDDMTFELMSDGLAGNGGRPRDSHGHGTHVSGIIAAATDNGAGVAGVAGYPGGSAAIMPLRVLDSQGFGWDSDINDAIYYAADNGAGVINMSLGGTGSSVAAQTAVDYATGKGTLVVAAAGNNYNTTLLYPAGYNDVVGVGATTNQNARASFSNYNSSVDLAAPGLNIYSTMPSYATYGSAVWGLNLNEDWMSGTSMATPVVAGAAALIKSLRPDFTPAEVEQRLRDTALDLGAVGRDDQFGWGLIDVGAALDSMPVTRLTASPPTPDGNSGWYTTVPTITFTADASCTTYYGWDSTATVTTYTAPFPTTHQGQKSVYYYSVTSQNDTETAQASVFKVDTIEPVASSLKIMNGATYTRAPSVTLNISGSDAGGSGLAKMRFKNEGGSWGAWENFSAVKNWTLTASEGTKRVYYETQDGAGNISPSVTDDIFYDGRLPVVSLTTPFIATKISKTASFKIRWGAADPSPSSGIASYTVRYRPANSSTWTDWKANTSANSGVFPGTAGRTYYFRVKATDRAGNTGWSSVRKTIVPYNEGANLFRRIGFNGYRKSSSSQFFLSSVRYSYTRGNELVYKFNGSSVGLVSTKDSSRGLAKIYIDGNYVKTIDTHSATLRPRQLIFYKSWAKKGTHFLKIVNLGTPGRARFDVDAIAVGQ